MERQEVEQIVEEKVKEVTKGLEEKLDLLTQKGAGDQGNGQGSGTDNNDQGAGTDNNDQNSQKNDQPTQGQQGQQDQGVKNELEALKSEISNRLETLEKELNVDTSQAPKGQDNQDQPPAVKEQDSDRDAYGRKRRKK